MGNMFTLASNAASGSSSSSFLPLLIIIALFAVFYFVMIRPQRNRQRQVQQMQNQIVPGQRVRTTAGMYATVTDVDGDDVTLEVSPGVHVRFMRRAIMDVVQEETGLNGAANAAADSKTEAADTTAAD